jgi:hypothetical protein
MNQPQFGGIPIIGIGDKILGVDMTLITPEIRSLRDLVELLAKLSQFNQLAKENDLLREEVEQLRKQRDVLSEVEGFLSDESYIVPSFPEDFTDYAEYRELNDTEIQDLINEVTGIELNEGESTISISDNTFVIKYVDESHTYTITASDFFENVQLNTHSYK